VEELAPLLLVTSVNRRRRATIGGLETMVRILCENLLGAQGIATLLLVRRVGGGVDLANHATVVALLLVGGHVEDARQGRKPDVVAGREVPWLDLPARGDGTVLAATIVPRPAQQVAMREGGDAIQSRPVTCPLRGKSCLWHRAGEQTHTRNRSDERRTSERSHVGGLLTSSPPSVVGAGHIAGLLRLAAVSCLSTVAMGKRANQAREATKRNIRGTRLSEAERAFLREHASYEGSPYHKRSPGDFGLIPPASPRPDATLCDEAGVHLRDAAQALFASAINGGLVSESATSEGFPRQLWVIDEQGRVFEAMYGGSRSGRYHGYPIRKSDPLFAQVQKAWGAN
jgi:hypothetical protein